MREVLCALMAFAIAGLGLIATEAQSNPTKTVFRIGIFDCSSAGFAMHLTAQHPDLRFSLDIDLWSSS